MLTPTGRPGKELPNVIYEVFLCPEHRTAYVHVFKSAGTTIAAAFMGVCNRTVSWYHWDMRKFGETFQARPGHEWGAEARATWQEAHARFRTGWLTGNNAKNVFEDWSFFTFVREPRSRLMSGIFEVALRVFNKKTRDGTPKVDRRARTFNPAVTAALPCKRQTANLTTGSDVLQCVLNGRQGGVLGRLSKFNRARVNSHILPQSRFLLGGRDGRTFIFPQLSHVGQVEYLNEELAAILSATMQVTTTLALFAMMHAPQFAFPLT